MKLDRNINPGGQGKYALVKLRKVWGNVTHQACMVLLDTLGLIDCGETPDTEFFVIKLKDKYAAPALLAYSLAAREDGQTEWADEVFRLAEKAANHPNKQQPN